MPAMTANHATISRREGGSASAVRRAATAGSRRPVEPWRHASEHSQRGRRVEAPATRGLRQARMLPRPSRRGASTRRGVEDDGSEAELLSKVPLFAGLVHATRARSVGSPTRSRCPPARSSPRRATSGDEFFVIVEARSRSARRQAPARPRPGDFFGELAMLGKVPRTATATAATPAACWSSATASSRRCWPTTRRSRARCSQAAGSRASPTLATGAPARTARRLSAGSPRSSTAAVRPSAGRDPHRHRGRAERVADVRVGPRLGEDEAADRPVAQHERAAAVAAIDLGAELEDVALDPWPRRRCRGPSRRYAPVTAAGHDRQRAAARVAERRPDRAAVRVGAPRSAAARRRRSGA